jgi:hypothetical protein
MGFTLRVLAVSVLCALPLRPSSAQTLWRPPEPLFERIERTTAARFLLSHFRLGPVTVTFEQTPLGEVQRAFPGSEVGEAGDAAGYVAWLCYVFGSGSHRSILWLQSGEMGGNENAVMGFTLLRMALTAQADRRCLGLPDSAAELGLPGPVQLGATRSQIIRALGRPSEEHGDTLGYFYRRHFPAQGRTPADSGYDVTGSLCILLRAGRAIRLEVWKLSTT